MNDKTITVDTLKSLEKFSAYADKTKNPYEIITSKCSHLVDIGEYIEAWLLGGVCFIFEDQSILVAFITTIGQTGK